MTESISDASSGPDTSEAVATPAASGIVYFDGQSSRRRDVRLAFGATCNIIEGDNLLASWPFADIRRADSPPGVLRASCEGAPLLARLEIRDETIAADFAARCPKFDEHKVGGKTVAKIVGWSFAAVISIFCVVIYGMPLVAEQLTPLIPESVEKKLGDAVDRQVKVIFDGKACTSEPGRAAFVKLVDALRQANNMDRSVEAAVIDNEAANAFALPGGKVYLLRGLLDKAESADEVAGILGHELGHVQHRDGMRNMIYTGGTSFLFGLLFGDVTGAGALIFVTRSLFDASYSRRAETDADTVAVETMHKLGRSPKPMGDLMLRITGAQADSSIPIMASHPLTEDRQARLAGFDRAATRPPILSDSEWAALKAICK